MTNSISSTSHIMIPFITKQELGQIDCHMSSYSISELCLVIIERIPLEKSCARYKSQLPLGITFSWELDTSAN